MFYHNFASAAMGQIKSPKLWCQTCTSQSVSPGILLKVEHGKPTSDPPPPPDGNAWCLGFKCSSQKFGEMEVSSGFLGVQCVLTSALERGTGAMEDGGQASLDTH